MPSAARPKRFAQNSTYWSKYNRLDTSSTAASFHHTGSMNEEHSRRGWRRYLAVKASLVRNGLAIPMDAQTLAEFLKLNPHMAAESRDNAKCKAFLGELGMLELFTRSNEPNLSALTCKTHPSHWIVGLLWSGYAKPEQNGYRVFCIPKQQVPEEVVKELVQEIMETYGGHGHEEGFLKLPPDWRKHN
jgi:hypothetical protein